MPGGQNSRASSGTATAISQDTGRKSGEKFFQRLASLKVIEQGLHRHSRSAKDRNATQNSGFLVVTSLKERMFWLVTSTMPIVSVQAGTSF
jgi:hypothetical protein